MGEYYREPKKAEGPLPLHLVEPLVRSFQSDHYVADEGDIVYYQRVSSPACIILETLRCAAGVKTSAARCWLPCMMVVARCPASGHMLLFRSVSLTAFCGKKLTGA